MNILSDGLRDWADVHEKSVFFMDDDGDLAEEATTETALLRAAADRIEKLEAVANATRQLRERIGSRARLADPWYGEVSNLDDALEALEKSMNGEIS